MYMSGAVIRTTEIEIYESVIVAIQSISEERIMGIYFCMEAFENYLERLWIKIQGKEDIICGDIKII